MERLTVLGAGLGYHIIKSDETSFDVFSGLTRNQERFTSEIRSSTEMLLGEESAHRLTASTSFNQRLACYRDVENASRYRTQIDAGLTTAVTERMALKITLSRRHQNDPPPGVPKTDNLFLTSIGYRFGPDWGPCGSLTGARQDQSAARKQASSNERGLTLSRP